jgi:hypothetical protein
VLPDNIKKVINIRNQRRQAYKTTFSNEAGKKVLADLSRFCGATECSYVPDSDPHLTVFREGRREVWLYIQKQLRLTEDQIYKLKQGEVEDA